MIASENELFQCFDRTLDLVCIADREGYFKRVNPAVVRTLEYSEEELFSRLISSFIHPDDREVTSRRRAELLEGNALVNFQNRYISKTGKVVWLDWTSVYWADKEVVFAIAKDVTDRKLDEMIKEERYQKYKDLASHFKSTVEEEKKRFAQTLHEELAQLASVTKMDIDWLRDHIGDLPAVSRDRMDHALSASEVLINSLRKISYSLSPDMIEDMGLTETLSWLCMDFSRSHRIPCRFVCHCNPATLTKEIQLDIFRICQEALDNVARHAKATEVTITISCERSHYCLTIADNGKGFVVKDSDLVGMRQRVSSMNGRLEIESEIGSGATVRVLV